MSSLSALYAFYCKRSQCKPNSRFATQLHNGDLEEFDFSINYVGPKGLAPVLEIVRNNANLRELNLSSNWLEQSSVAAVVETCTRHPSLTTLRLNGNPIHAGSFRPLAYLIANNKNIKTLEVASTEISEYQQNQLKELLNKNQDVPFDDSKLKTRITTQERGPDVRVATYKGSWTDCTAGGCLQFSTWRYNPQLLLWPSRSGLATIAIRQSQGDLKQHAVGIAVIKGCDADCSRSTLDVQPTDVLAESNFEYAHACVSVNLEARERGKDVPYTLIPMTVRPGKTGSFAVSIKEEAEHRVGVHPDDNVSTLFTLQPIPPHLDWWKAPVVHGEWSATTSGGNADHVTWRNNPQYLLASKAKSKVMVVLSKHGLQDDENDSRRIGLYALSSKDGKVQREVIMTRDNSVASTAFRCVPAISLTFELPGNGGGFVLIPATSEPGQEGQFTLSLFAETEVDITPLDTANPQYAWHVSHITGAWTSDTNGGSRAASAQMWVNNPSYALRTSEHCDLLVILRKIASSEVTTKQSALADLDKTAVLTICDFDEGLNEVKTGTISQPALTTHDEHILSAIYNSSRQAAKDDIVELWCPHTPLAPNGYLIVPSTVDAGAEFSFEITVYSSKPVEVGSNVVLLERLNAMETARCKLENSEVRPGRCLDMADSAFKGDPDMLNAVAECEAIVNNYLRKGVQHSDREFPPAAASISIDAGVPSRSFPLSAWRRPCDYRVDACLFAGGPQSGEVRPGMIDDIWFLGAAAMVATNPQLLEHIFLSVYPEYGFYQLRFFKCGKWVPVTIDDMLPVDASNRPVFASSPQPNELWPAVLEKAYAKLHDSYEALEVDGRVPHALSDLTGGYPQTIDISHSKSKAVDWVWDVLRHALRSGWPVGLMLCSKKGTRVEEKSSMGIPPDHVFPLLEVRDVRGNRLLRLRDCWGINSWKGKWRDGSTHWTAEMADALQYEFTDDGTFWVGGEELAYYFTTIFICRLHGKHRATQPDTWECVAAEGGWVEGVSDGGNVLAGGDDWVRNGQYAFDVEVDHPGEEVPIWVQIEQRDARMDIIKTVSNDRQTLAYPTQMGFHLVASDCNTRKLVAITSKEHMRTTPFTAERIVGQEFHITPGTKRYTIIPSTAVSGQTGEYLLSVVCPKPITLQDIQSNLNVTVKGAWKGLSRGGAPRYFGTWRDNPMYLLTCNEATTLTIILKQHNDVDSTTAKIGCLVVDGKGVRRPLSISDEDIIASAEPDNADKVTAKVVVQGTKERAGLPYVIIPYTQFPRQDSQFTLDVVGNKRAVVTEIDPCIDYLTITHTGEWSQKAGTSGGFIRYPTWRNSPQYLLKFQEPQAKMLIVLSKKMQPCVTCDTLETGMFLFKGTALEGGCRQRVSAPIDADIIAQTDFVASTTGFCEISVTLPYNRHGYVIIPCTRHPYTEGSYQMSVYTDSDLQITRPPSDKAWLTHVFHGEWKPGVSAGGARNQHRTWGCNPSYRLTVKEHANVVVVLTQLPIRPGQTSGHLRPAAKKQSQPPGINDARYNTSIAVDLCQDDEGLTHLTRTEFAYLPEVTLSLPYASTGSFVIVPHTFESELASEYTLTIYTDSPSVSVEPIQKQGRYY